MPEFSFSSFEQDPNELPEMQPIGADETAALSEAVGRVYEATGGDTVPGHLRRMDVPAEVVAAAVPELGEGTDEPAEITFARTPTSLTTHDYEVIVVQHRPAGGYAEAIYEFDQKAGMIGRVIEVTPDQPDEVADALEAVYRLNQLKRDRAAAEQIIHDWLIDKPDIPEDVIDVIKEVAVSEERLTDRRSLLLHLNGQYLGGPNEKMIAAEAELGLTDEDEAVAARRQLQDQREQALADYEAERAAHADEEDAMYERLRVLAEAEHPAGAATLRECFAARGAHITAAWEYEVAQQLRPAVITERTSGLPDDPDTAALRLAELIRSAVAGADGQGERRPKASPTRIRDD